MRVWVPLFKITPNLHTRNRETRRKQIYSSVNHVITVSRASPLPSRGTFLSSSSSSMLTSNIASSSSVSPANMLPISFKTFVESTISFKSADVDKFLADSGPTSVVASSDGAGPPSTGAEQCCCCCLSGLAGGGGGGCLNCSEAPGDLEDDEAASTGSRSGVRSPVEESSSLAVNEEAGRCGRL